MHRGITKSLLKFASTPRAVTAEIHAQLPRVQETVSL